jgi:hypothetical protein
LHLFQLFSYLCWLSLEYLSVTFLSYISQLHFSVTFLSYISQLHFSVTFLSYISHIAQLLLTHLYLHPTRV